MLKFKEGVSLKRITPQISIALQIVSETYSGFGFHATITSGSDGVHGPRSLHPEGDAIDVRIYNIPGYVTTDDWKTAGTRETIRDVVKDLHSKLHHVGFDVIEEKDHLHIEYDPK